MRHRKHSEAESIFFARVRELEEQFFGDQLDPNDKSRIKSDRYSWHYRPSHHAATGLITQEDCEALSQPGKRLLSIGASPPFLEQLFPHLGIPGEHIVIADKDPQILNIAGAMQKEVFDMTNEWPNMGDADLIIFPESLCIALSNKLEQEIGDLDNKKSEKYASDFREAELLAAVLRQALERLRPGGEIRANGPMSHPNVMKMAQLQLLKEGYDCVIEYERFFLRVRKK